MTTPSTAIEDEIGRILATIQHRTNYYNDRPHDYEWRARTATDGDEGLICSCGFHVRKEWLDEAHTQISNLLLSSEINGRIKEIKYLQKNHPMYISGFPTEHIEGASLKDRLKALKAHSNRGDK